MSLKGKYRKLYIVTVNESIDPFTGTGGGEVKTSFMGLIQAPSNANTFINGKDSTSISGILFTSIKTQLKEKDLIEDPKDGTRYIVAVGGQGNGVTGIKPKRGQHAEYSLVFDNKGV